jgi:hypothetical protein
MWKGGGGVGVGGRAMGDFRLEWRSHGLYKYEAFPTVNASFIPRSSPSCNHTFTQKIESTFSTLPAFS